MQMPAAASFAAVNNFVFLARYQYFNGTYFHRVIPGFIVQAWRPDRHRKRAGRGRLARLPLHRQYATGEL